jgi:hypothetical protein
VDVSSLGAGRPRDLCSAGPNTHAVQQPEMREVLQQEQEAHCLVVATSAGQMLVLSANQLEEQGLADAAAAAAPASAGSSKDKESAEDKTSAAEKSMLSSNQLRAEPRLTAVVAWNPAAAAAVAGNIVLCYVMLCCTRHVSCLPCPRYLNGLIYCDLCSYMVIITILYDSGEVQQKAQQGWRIQRS